MERIIRLSIEGKWKYKGDCTPYIPEYMKAPGIAQFSDDGIDWLITKEQALMDPELYKALGRQQGWGRDEKLIESIRSEVDYENRSYENCLAYPTETEQFARALENQRQKIGRLYLKLDDAINALEWKEHKARALAANDDGGSAEDYFSSIIK